MELTLENDLLDKIGALRSKVGNTPLLPIENLHRNPKIKIYAKAEWAQLSGSVKARAAYAIIKKAIENGSLNQNRVLLDATSGNTGIAYGSIARELGIKVTLCLPENASDKRREILTSLGVNLIYTSKFGGTDEAQQVAKSLADANPGKYFYANQYANDQNWLSHYHTTGAEIINEVPGITHFVAGLGTTGTFIGTGRRLKAYSTSIKLVSLQPDSPLHGLEGWKHLETATVPEFFDPYIADDTAEVDSGEAYNWIRKFYDVHGILLSPSSAANLAGALTVADRIEEGNIVTIFPDDAYKYREIISKIIPS